MQDTIEKIDSLIASDNSEAAINLILTLDDSKLNGHILKGCTIDEYGNVKIDAGYLADSTMKHYLFYTVLCLSQDSKLLDKSLQHKHIKKISINEYRNNEFPPNIHILKNLEELTINLDYTIQNNSDDLVLKLLPKLKKLKSLSLNTKEFNNSLELIFKSIYNLNNLESLTIKAPIPRIPVGIKKLKKLKNIDLNCTELLDVSNEFISLNLESIYLRSRHPRIQREFDKMFELNYEREKAKKINIKYSKIDYTYSRSR